ncbi:MAG: hypothetical protein AAFX93_00380 [Verrucomicrobiota bacterium]
MEWLSQNLKIAGGALLLAAIAIYFIISGESGPEAEVNQRLDKLCDLVSFESPEPQIEQITRAKKFSNLFVDSPYLVAWKLNKSITDKDALTGLFVTTRRMANSANVSMGSRQITVAPSGKSATVTATIKGNVQFKGDSESYSGRYRIQLEKIGGDWLISTVEPLD